MDAQLCLPGIAPAPPRVERFYFALLPDISVQSRLLALGAGLQPEYAAGYRPIQGHRLHLSLHHLGDHVAVPGQYLERAIRAVERVSHGAFRIRFDHAMVFSGRTRGAGRFPLACCAREGAEHVQALALALAESLLTAGLPADPGRRLPHVTLGYTHARMSPRPVPPIEWPVSHFALVHVRIGMERRHRVLGRWPLNCHDRSPR